MGIRDYSTTPADNATAGSVNYAENQAPSTLNDSGRQVLADIREWYEDAQWVDLGHTPTYVSATSFTIATDVTATYETNRRIKMYGATMGTFYGTISSSSYGAPNTTVNVTMDSGSLTNNLSQVYVGILTATNHAMPSTPILGTATFSSAGVMTAGTVPMARLGFKGALVTKTATQSTATATATLITFDGETYDTDAFHDNATNTDRLTVPAGVSYVRIHARIVWTSNATGYREVRLNKNGSEDFGGQCRIAVPAASGIETKVQFTSPPLAVSENDYFQLYATQASGGALDVLGSASGALQSWFAIEVVN